MVQENPFIDGYRLIDGTELNDQLANPSWSVSSPVTATAGGDVNTSYKAVFTITNVTSAQPNAGVTIEQALPGRVLVVQNNSANFITVFAAGGSTIDGVPGNIGVTVPPASNFMFTAVSVDEWVSMGAFVDTSSMPTVATIAALRNFTYVPGRFVYVEGYNTAGDYGGGVFYAAPQAAVGTYVEDYGYVIRPTGGNGSQAWLRSPTMDVTANQFGAYGNATNDDSTAITRAIAYCKAHSLASLHFCDGIYIISTTITLTGSGIALVGDPGSRQQGSTRAAVTLRWAASVEVPAPVAGAIFTCTSSATYYQFWGMSIENYLNATAFVYIPLGAVLQSFVLNDCSFIPTSGTVPYTDAVIYAPASNALGYSVIKDCQILLVANYFLRINGGATSNGITPILVDNNLIDVSASPAAYLASITKFTMFSLETEGLDILTFSNNTFNQQNAYLGYTLQTNAATYGTGSIALGTTLTGYTPGYYRIVMTTATDFDVYWANLSTGPFTTLVGSGTTGVLFNPGLPYGISFTVTSSGGNPLQAGATFLWTMGVTRELTVFDSSTNTSTYKITTLNITSNEFDVAYAGVPVNDHLTDRLFKLTNVENVNFTGNQLAMGGHSGAIFDLVNSNITACAGNSIYASGYVFSNLFAFSTAIYKYAAGNSGNNNDGNGTISAITGGFGATPATGARLAPPATQEGYYSVLFSDATNFTVYDPQRVNVGAGTVGVPFSYVNGAGFTEITFTVNAGTIAWAAGDVMDILAYLSNISVDMNVMNAANTYAYGSQLANPLQIINVPVKQLYYTFARGGGMPVGNTLTGPTALPTAVPGNYTILMTTATDFDVTDPSGAAVGSGTIGTKFANQIKFTAGGTGPWAAGNFFTFTVYDTAFINPSLASPSFDAVYHISLFRDCGFSWQFYNQQPYGWATRGQRLSVRISNNSGAALTGTTVRSASIRLGTAAWFPITNAYSVTFGMVWDVNAAKTALNLFEVSRSAEIPV